MVGKLIEEDRYEIYLQPIISIKDKKIFAYEALTRAKDSEGNFISPIALFEEARKENLTLLLDNKVRQKAIEKFQKIYEKDMNAILFLNLESIFIEKSSEVNILELSQKYNIPTQNIVIEIKEDAIKDNSYLEIFVNNYRDQGFIIAIDDFGTGYSSFDRLSIIKPDIVKVDRSLIYNIHNNYINEQILNAISDMCHNIGALVLAEGVEEKGEILKCMGKDIDIYQGFYLCKPQANITQDHVQNIKEKIDIVGNEYKQTVRKGHKRRKSIIRNIKRVIKNKLDDIDLCFDQLHKELHSILKIYQQLIEAIYIIDHETGIQKDNTFTNIIKRSFYLPTKEGHDHSLKDYYYITKESKKGDYLGPRYISKASGNPCRTYSCKLKIEEKEFIVCFDLVGKYVFF